MKKRKGSSKSSSLGGSSSSTLSTSNIEAAIEKLKAQQHRDSTRKNYHNIWMIFNKFFLRLDVKPLDWGHRLILFAGHLVETGKKSTTIRSYLSVIRSILKVEGIDEDADTYVLNALTRACKLENDIVTARLPISRDMLEMLIKKIPDVVSNQPYLITLYRALFLTTYIGLFRIGEVTSSPHAIKAKDVFIGTNKNKLLFILRSSKTHCKADKPQSVKIDCKTINQDAYSPDKLIKTCPFEALRTYIATRPGFRQADKQFFVFSDNSPVTPSHMRDILSQLLNKCNFDNKLYSVHSLHGGRAFSLLNLGLSVETIKKIGRWKSNAVFRYLRQL